MIHLVLWITASVIPSRIHQTASSPAAVIARPTWKDDDAMCAKTVFGILKWTIPTDASHVPVTHWVPSITRVATLTQANAHASDTSLAEIATSVFQSTGDYRREGTDANTVTVILEARSITTVMWLLANADAGSTWLGERVVFPNSSTLLRVWISCCTKQNWRGHLL